MNIEKSFKNISHRCYGSPVNSRVFNTPPQSAYAPEDQIENSLNKTFNENAWQNDSIINITNCASYAYDLPDAGVSVPGDLRYKNRGDTIMGAGYYRAFDSPQEITRNKVRRLIKRDGFIPISREEALSLSSEFKVFACYVAPHYDYHFVRKDGKYWTDKLGRPPPPAH